MKKKKKEIQEKKETKKVNKTPVINVPSNTLSHTLLNMENVGNNSASKIVVLGVGGGGCNIINAIVKSKIENIITVACNTDVQALENNLSEKKLQLGPKLTKGHGAGANPEVGKLSAQESKAEIDELLNGAHVVFVVAGMGGGTGTGAAPELAKSAISKGILTIGLVTTPFNFEGDLRKNAAKKGIEDLQEHCDVMVVFSNEYLKKMNDSSISFLNAFSLVDNVLCSSLNSFVNTITKASRINIDMADFFTIMKGKKSRAVIGTSIAIGEDKCLRAAKDLLANVALYSDSMNISNINGGIISIKCGSDSKLEDINAAISYIKSNIHKDAYIIFGADIIDNYENQIEMSFFATFNSDKNFEQNIDLLTFDDEQFIGKPHSHHINETMKSYESKKQEEKKSVWNIIYNLFFNK